ncbi:MAG: putative phage abortive infection protein [Methanobrevibacter sp.]|nr:putative phage abortive infection protein [Methanobrevibacter sp.]
MEKIMEAIYGAILSFVKKNKAISTFCLCLFIIGSPAIFTRSCSHGLNFSQTGQIGDTFAIMNPFIAIVAAVLTFIAFWTQYKANKEMLKNNDKQQEERQFYEMLKIHKDNIDKLTMDARINQKDTMVKGSSAIRLLQIEFTNIHTLTLFNYNNKGLDETAPINKKQAFDDAYRIFFLGNEWAANQERLSIVYNMIKDSQKNGTFNSANGVTEYTREGLSINPYKFGLGHVEQFDPYYRHLYHMVKSVVLSKKFDDDEKIRFLKILRAQMTSDEQILLLYNWRSGYGKKWESEEVRQYFFSKYYMIHNIFPSSCVFDANEIFGMFPHASEDEKKKMFEHIEYQPQNQE